MIILVYRLNGSEHRLEVTDKPHIADIRAGDTLLLNEFDESFGDNKVHCHVHWVHYSKTAKEVHLKLDYK